MPASLLPGEEWQPLQVTKLHLLVGIAYRVPCADFRLALRPGTMATPDLPELPCQAFNFRLGWELRRFQKTSEQHTTFTRRHDGATVACGAVRRRAPCDAISLADLAARGAIVAQRAARHNMVHRQARRAALPRRRAGGRQRW